MRGVLMEEKPLGTPNPLNPNLGAAQLNSNQSRPAGPIDMIRPMVKKPAPTPPPAPVAPTPVAPPVPAPVPTPTPVPTPPLTPEPIPEPTPTPQATISPDPFASLGVITNMDGTPSEKIDPMDRPMAKSITPEEQKAEKAKKSRGRRRTKLMAGVIISLFVAISCAVAAILIIVNGPKVDVVAVAVNKLMSGQAPTNVMIDGTIDIKMQNTTSEISSLKISIGTEAVTKSLINSTRAKLNVNLKSGNSFSAEVSEIYAANGDLYLRIDGVNELFANTALLGSEATESLGSILKDVDGEWVRVALNDFGEVLPDNIAQNDQVSCLTDLVGSMNSNNNLISGAYLKNPFIISTSEGLPVPSQRDPIYKVVISEQNLQAFLEETAGSTTVKSLAACVGPKNNANTVDALMKAAQELPEIYVEVDGEDRFTRLYTFAEWNNGGASTAVDLMFSYPENVNVPEPVEYKDFRDIIKTDERSPEAKTD